MTMKSQTNSTKNKHLTLSERIIIEQLLNDGKTFSSIANEVGKSPTTISAEVMKHRYEKLRSNTFNGGNKNTKDCLHAKGCAGLKTCKGIDCKDYQYAGCAKLKTPPYVCNSCKKRGSCRKRIWHYSAKTAYDNYCFMLKDSRRGISLSKDEFNYLDDLVSPLIVRGQSPFHIYSNHKDDIACSERTLYRYLAAGTLSASLMDLQRQVRYKQRRKKGTETAYSYEYRQGRTYQDFLNFTDKNPGYNIVEMDTVLGCAGTNKVLLTLFFRNCSFMLAFIMPDNTQKSVISVFNHLQKNIDTDSYKNLFPVILTDNGSEFKAPVRIEFETQNGEQVSHVFYCDPNVTNQKSRIEKNHEFIRYVVPKGKSFDAYDQPDITKLINHINSLSRESLGGNTPFDMASMLLDKSLFALLGLEHISPDEVHLKPSLLK